MKLVILDRDGVINPTARNTSRPGRMAARRRQPGRRSPVSPRRLQVVVATNQAGLGRGLFDMAALNAMRQDAQGGKPAGRAHRRRVLLPARAGRGLRLPQATAGHAAGIAARYKAALEGAGDRRLAARPAGGGAAAPGRSLLTGKANRRSRPAACPRTEITGSRRRSHRSPYEFLRALIYYLHRRALWVMVMCVAWLPRIPRWKIIMAGRAWPPGWRSMCSASATGARPQNIPANRW